MLLVGFDSAAAFSSSEVSMSTAIGFSRVPSLKHGATTDAAERVSTCVGPPLPWSIAGSLVPVVWLHHALLVLHHHLLLVVVIVDLDHWSPAMPPMTTRNRSGVFGAVRRTTAHSFTSSGCSRQARRPPCSCLIKEGAERITRGQHSTCVTTPETHKAPLPFLSSTGFFLDFGSLVAGDAFLLSSASFLPPPPPPPEPPAAPPPPPPPPLLFSQARMSIPD